MTMPGFTSPNYTQTPNDLFDSLMRDMEESELRVVLAVIRGTFGYHRNIVQLSIRKMAAMTGLSTASIWAGAEAAEKRGLIKRTVDGKNSTYWEAIVDVSTTDTPDEGVSTIDTVVYQPLIQAVSTTDTQSGLNKYKEIKAKNIDDDKSSSNGKPLTEGLKFFLKSFGAARFKNLIQRDTMLALEKKHGTAKLKEFTLWAAKNGMTVSKAVAAAENGLQNWGKVKVQPIKEDALTKVARERGLIK